MTRSSAWFQAYDLINSFGTRNDAWFQAFDLIISVQFNNKLALHYVHVHIIRNGYKAFLKAR